MNIVYVVTPLALLAAFAGYVVPASARLDTSLAARAATEEQQRAVERHAQEAQREIAAREQRERMEERIRREAEKERDAVIAQEKRDHTLSDNLAEAQAARESLRNEIAALANRLQELTAEGNGVDAALGVARSTLALRQIERRNADLELQRMTLLLADAVDASIDAGAPLFPAPHDR